MRLLSPFVSMRFSIHYIPLKAQEKYSKKDTTELNWKPTVSQKQRLQTLENSTTGLERNSWIKKLNKIMKQLKIN